MRSAQRLALLRVVAGAVVSSHQVAVALALRSRRRCLRRCAGAPGAGAVVTPHSRRRVARWPLFCSGGSVSVQCVVPGDLRFCVWSLARSLPLIRWRVAVALRSRRRCLRRGAGAPVVGLDVPPHSRRSDARPPLFHSSTSLAVRCIGLSGLRFCVLSLARSLPLHGAVAVAQRSRRRCLRRRAGAPAVGSVAPPRSRQHDGLSPLFCGGGSLSARCVVLGGSRFCVWSLARSLPLQGWSPSRSAHGTAVCGAALALLPPAQSRRRARGSMTVCRRSSAAAARSLRDA